MFPIFESRKLANHFISSNQKLPNRSNEFIQIFMNNFLNSRKIQFTYNFIFLDKITQYIFMIPISNKSSQTIEEEFSQRITAIERETGQKVRYL